MLAPHAAQYTLVLHKACWFVGAVIYKNISFKDTLNILKDSGLLAGALMLISAGASAFSWILVSTGTPADLAAKVLACTDSPVLIALLFNVIILVAGFFLDSTSAIIILSPLMQPIAAQVGIDPIHFGIITLVNLSVGMLTSPVGLNLFVAMKIAKMSLYQVVKASFPFIILMLIALLVITYIPTLSLGLPNLLF